MILGQYMVTSKAVGNDINLPNLYDFKFLVYRYRKKGIRFVNEKPLLDRHMLYFIT